jgi:uncharacterized repeat protein (TIGR03803 family)/autotransporter-associated beta strand protein
MTSLSTGLYGSDGRERAPNRLHAAVSVSRVGLWIAVWLVASELGAQTLTTLFQFNGSNGASPGGDLTLSGSTLYGLTTAGGVSGDGTAFSIPVIGGTASTLASFNKNTSGANPNGNLTLSGSTLYGMTQYGGPGLHGTVFSIPVSGGAPTTLLSFNVANGANPAGSLTLSGSTLYGLSRYGGANGDGTVFSIPTSGGAANTLLSFNGLNGEYPPGSLTFNGSTLYGMTQYGGGGPHGSGTVFSLPVSGGAATTLLRLNDATGKYPLGSLILSGSTLYGMTQYGGANDFGTVFSVPATGGAATTLLSFSGTDGAYPAGSLILNGSTLYGMTQYGGANGDGTIFSMPLSGGPAMTLLSFNGANGANPTGSLLLSGSTLYGMTQYGGANGDGTIFALNTGPGNLLFWTGQNGAGGSVNPSWDTTTSSTNWTDGMASQPFDGRGVVFGDVNYIAGGGPIASTTVTVQATGVSPASVTFDNSNINYTVGNAGGTIGITGATSLVMNGAGVVTLTSVNTYSGGTFFNSGTINASSLANLGSGGLTFNGGTLQFGAPFDISTRSVTIGAGGATFDTNQNDVAFTNSIGASSQQLILTKTGAGTLELDGGLAMGDASALHISAGSLVFKLTAGSATVGAGVTAAVSNDATLELAGSVAALSSGSNRVSVNNSSSSPGLLVSGTHQQVGSIDGSGTTQVNAGSDLTANHIVQAALVIGGAVGSPALVTIDASDSAGNPLAIGAALSSSPAPSGGFEKDAGVSISMDSSAVINDVPAAPLPAVGGSLNSTSGAALPEPSSFILVTIGAVAVVTWSPRTVGAFRGR